jgi:hypothetical protein
MDIGIGLPNFLPAAGGGFRKRSCTTIGGGDVSPIVYTMGTTGFASASSWWRYSLMPVPARPS